MNAVQFNRYRPSGADPVIVVERITHWYRIDYNGNSGTCIVLDTGAEICVGDYEHEVEHKLRQLGWSIAR